jgi:hypothetical protein
MKQKHFTFITLIIAIFCLWPQFKSPGQAGDHPAPATLEAKEEMIEKKLTASKETIYDEIERIKNLPPKTVIKNRVKTVYKYVPKVIFIDTCLAKMQPDTFLNLHQYDTTRAPMRLKKQNFFKSLFEKLFHPKKTNS